MFGILSRLYAHSIRNWIILYRDNLSVFNHKVGERTFCKHLYWFVHIKIFLCMLKNYKKNLTLTNKKFKATHSIFLYCINSRNGNDIFKIKDNCMVHKIFPKTFPKSVSYILLKCLYASHSPGGVPKTAIKFHILHFFLLQLTYTGFSTKYFTTK